MIIISTNLICSYINMGKLIKKRLIEWSNIDDSKFQFVLEEYFSKKHFTTKYAKYQSEVDEYFYEKWIEAKHFFIFDDEKNYQLDELISKTDDKYRKLELELLKCWVAYNKEDIFSFWKIYDDKLLYENIEYSHRKNIIVLFDEINFEEKDWVESIISIVYDKWWHHEKSSTKVLKSRDEDFWSFVNILNENWLLNFYIIEKDKYILKLKEEFKKDIVKKINNDEWLKQKLKWFFTYKISSLKIDEWLNNFVYWKSELNDSISYEDLKYLIIWNIKDNHIQQNKIYLESSEEEVIWVLSNTKYENLFKKYKNTWDYLLFIKEDDKWKNKLCKFIYKKEWETRDITNYKIFREIVINNQGISIELKDELTEIFKKSLPIVWVTVSWKQSQTSWTITPFFEMYQKIHNEWMGNIIRSNGLNTLITLDYDFIWINIDFSNFELKIKETFNEKMILTYKKRIKERIWYCSTVYWYLVE